MEREGRKRAKKKELKWDFIRKNRSWPEVKDVLGLKVKYIKEEEERYRKEYEEEKRKTAKWYKKKKKVKKYRNILDKIRITNEKRWKKGLEERKRKVEWLGRKLRGNRERRT